MNAVWAKGIGFAEPIELRRPLQSLEKIHRITVRTAVAPFPNAQSAALMVEVIEPDPDDWCVDFKYREGTEQSVYGDGWSVTFFRWNANRDEHVFPFRPIEDAKEKITLPLHSYTVRASTVYIPRQLSVMELFRRHLRSAETMRDQYLADLKYLKDQVITRIRDDKVNKTVLGEYQGNGIDPSYPAPLTSEEKKVELKKANAFFAKKAHLMREHYDEMYASWRACFPVERCWPELRE